MDSSETLDSDDSQINLLILGSGGFAQAMESEIRVCTCIYYLSLLIVFGYRLYGVIIKTEIITIIMVIIEQNCLSLISRLKTFTYNLLYFNISMQVFHTVPYNIPVILTRKICLAIESFLSLQSFPLSS